MDGMGDGNGSGILDGLTNEMADAVTALDAYKEAARAKIALILAPTG